MNRLILASDKMVDFAAQAISEWIGPDLIVLQAYPALFELAAHVDRRLQTRALMCLKQTMTNPAQYPALIQAGLISVIQTLSATDEPDATRFVIAALPALAVSAARAGSLGVIFHVLATGPPGVREAAAAGLQNIMRESVADRKILIDDNVLEKLTGGADISSRVTNDLSTFAIARLTPDYVEADKINFVLTLIEYVFSLKRIEAHLTLYLFLIVMSSRTSAQLHLPQSSQ